MHFSRECTVLERDYGLVPTHRGGLRLLYSSSPPICCALHFSTLNFWKIASGFKSSENLFLYIGKAFMSCAKWVFNICTVLQALAGSVCFLGKPLGTNIAPFFFNIFKNGCKFVKSCKKDIKGLLFVELSRSGAYFSHIYALFIDFCHTRRLQDFGKVSKKIYNLKVQNEDRKGFLKKLRCWFPEASLSAAPSCSFLSWYALRALCGLSIIGPLEGRPLHIVQS